MDGTLFVPGTAKSARLAAAFSGLLYSAAPELLVTLRLRNCASSPENSRKPMVPVA